MTRVVKQRPSATVKRGEAEMTWEEIAEALGYTGKRRAAAVFMVYQGAMKKIRRNPEACKRLRELVEMRNAQAPAQRTMPDWGA